jgi:hypothetical protein
VVLRLAWGKTVHNLLAMRDQPVSDVRAMTIGRLGFGAHDAERLAAMSAAAASAKSAVSIWAA